MDGRADRWIRRVIKFCNALGVERYRTVEIHHAPGTQALHIPIARRIRAGQWLSAQRTERSLSDPDSRLYFDLRAESLTFTDARVGDMVEVVWRLRDVTPHPAMPGEYGEIAYLQEEIPRLHTVVEYGGPAADGIKVGLVSKGLPITHKMGRIEGHNMPPVSAETGGPGSTDILAYVHLSTQDSWADVDRAYARLLGARGLADPALAAEARRVVRGIEHRRAQVARLYALVVDRIRYVGLEYGIHSFQPARPAETWSRGYGDCKDKAILLVALLRAIGIKARFALIRTRLSGKITQVPASLSAFDHAMVYLPEFNQFIDPTVEQNSPWTLPAPDQGATALVIGEGRLRTVPFSLTKGNLTQWRFQLNWKPSGISGRGELTARGQPGSQLRRLVEPSLHRQRRADQRLQTQLPGFRFSNLRADGLRPAYDPVVISGAVTPTDGEMLNAEDGQTIPTGLNSWDLLRTWAPSAQRRTPLTVPYPLTRSLRYSLALPPSFHATVMDTVRRTSDMGDFTLRVSKVKNRLEIDIQWVLNATRIDPADYPRFRQWLAQIDALLTEPIRIKQNAL